MRQGIVIGKKIMRQGDFFHMHCFMKGGFYSVSETGNFDATGYTFGPFFMRQGAGCGEVSHTTPSLP